MIQDPSSEPDLWDEARLIMVAEAPENHRLYAEWMQRLMKSAQISFKDLQKKTKIPEPYLRALLEAQFDKIPYEAMGRGFSESIAKILTTDTAPLLAAYRALNPKLSKKEPLIPPSPPKNPHSSFLTTLKNHLSSLFSKTLKSKTQKKLAIVTTLTLLLTALTLLIINRTSSPPTPSFSSLPANFPTLPSPAPATPQTLPSTPNSQLSGPLLESTQPTPPSPLQKLTLKVTQPTTITLKKDQEKPQEISLTPNTPYTLSFLSSAEIKTPHIERLNIHFNDQDLGTLTPNLNSDTLRFTHISSPSTLETSHVTDE